MPLYVTIDQPASEQAIIRERRLARNGAVTLDNDPFTAPTCGTPTTGGSSTTSTTTGDGTTTTSPESGDGTATGAGAGGGGAGDSGNGTTTGGGTGIGTRFAAPESPGSPATPGAPATPAITHGGPGVPSVVGPPRTGGGPLKTSETSGAVPLMSALIAGAIALAIGRAVTAARRSTAARDA